MKPVADGGGKAEGAGCGSTESDRSPGRMRASGGVVAKVSNSSLQTRMKEGVNSTPRTGTWGRWMCSSILERRWDSPACRRCDKG